MHFTEEGGTGACGTAHDDSFKLVALASGLYDADSHCGDYVTITNTDNGKSVTALVADRCPGCQERSDYSCAPLLSAF